MTVAQIIDVCGGKVEVAYRLGKLHTATVDQWIHRGGVPLKYWKGIQRLARQRGHQITAAQLQAASTNTKE